MMAREKNSRGAEARKTDGLEGPTVPAVALTPEHASDLDLRGSRSSRSSRRANGARL